MRGHTVIPERDHGTPDVWGHFALDLSQRLLLVDLCAADRLPARAEVDGLGRGFEAVLAVPASHQDDRPTSDFRLLAGVIVSSCRKK